VKRYAAACILAILAAALVLGIAQLFALRFESGDVYPPYSSLRADPLGTMVFFESLEGLPDFSVQRDYSTSNRLPEGSQTAYLHLAATMESWQHISVKDFAEIDRFINNGGRLVIALSPIPAEIVLPLETKAEPKDVEDEAPKEISVIDRWGVNSKVVNLEPDDDAGYRPAQVYKARNLPLPDTLDWHSGIVFTDLNPAWKPVFVRGADPVVIERQFGKGSVVFASDSYFLSNEAMRVDRQTGLLAWLIGPDRVAVFDEAHLGVTENAGIATLMRRYRLHWLIASLVLLAVLFIWKNATHLVPISQEERQADFVLGKEAGAGFVTLLRRSIPARDILSTCFNEWKKTMAHGDKHAAARCKLAEAAIDERNPVGAYQSISNIIQKRTP
jgi:hypothetical protein